MNSYGRESVRLLSCCLLVQMRWCWEILKANLQLGMSWVGENREQRGAEPDGCLGCSGQWKNTERYERLN